VLEELVAPRCRHFVNVCTSAMLWTNQMSLEVYCNFLANAKGHKPFYFECTATMRPFNPVTIAMTVLLGFFGVPGIQEVPR